jgi:VanZ family protein
MMIHWFEKHNKISLIITILIAIFIFYISSLTFEAGVPGPEFRFKPIAYHFLIFFLFSFFLLITLTKGEKINFFLLAIIISVIYAISDEFHQLFVLGRNFAISDILTDSAGVFFAGLLYSFRIRLLQSKYFS